MTKKAKKTVRSSTNSGNYTFINAEQLKSNFFAKAKDRIKSKEKGNSSFAGDAGYWDGGHCDWGGTHKLDEDAEVLANFFNSIANISEDINNIRLSANESIFKANQQALISKIQGLGAKCRITSSTSIGNICIIWNDFFGSFLKKFLDNFSSKLQKQLKAIEKLEPKHQKELLDLESQARAAESSYRENLQKANDPNLSESEKAQFIILANNSAKEAEKIKHKITRNPLMEVGNFNYLDDLKALAKGNVPKNVSSDKNNHKGSSNNKNNNFLLIYRKEIFIFISLIGIASYIYFQEDDDNEKETMPLVKAMSGKRKNK